MSYDEISYTLQTLGINNGKQIQQAVKDKQHPLSREKVDKYFAEHKSAFESHRQETESLAPSYTSGQNSRQSSQRNLHQSRDSSSLSRYDGSLETKNKRRQSMGCPNCLNGAKRATDENSEYGSNPQERIRYLEQRIKSLESQMGKKLLGQNMAYNDQYFMKVQPENCAANGQKPSRQEQQFASMCIDMVSKLTKIERPSLKYCWKFLKTNISNSIRQEGIAVEFPVSPVKRKVDFVLHQTKQVLGVRKNESIPEAVRKLKQENDVLRKVYEKILKLFQLKVTHPYMLAYYLEDYTEKITRYEAEDSESA